MNSSRLKSRRVPRSFGFIALTTCLILAPTAPAGDELPRIFQEPMVAMNGVPPAKETEALRGAMKSFAAGRAAGQPDWSALTSFLAKYPKSPWRASLLLNLAGEYRRNGYLSRALESWRHAWDTGKTDPSPEGTALANRAAAELLLMWSRVGRVDDMKLLLEEVRARQLQGVTAGMIKAARDALEEMENRPERSFRCGIHALESILTHTQPERVKPQELIQSVSPAGGLKLPEVAALSRQIGLNLQMARRERDAAIPVPSVVHWKLGHYAALVKRENGRYLVDDPAAENGLVWISGQALSSESSGCFLIPPGPLPRGWRALTEDQAAQIKGRGYPATDLPGSVGPGNPAAGPATCATKGMASWQVYLMMCSLNLTDTPLGYQPPVGPAISLTVTYNQRESNQPALPAYANFGPQWNCNWISHLTFDTATATLHRGEGGTETFTGFDPATQSWQPGSQLANRLVRISATHYELREPDGSSRVFNQPDNPVSPFRIFMSRIVDPRGNAVTLTWDAGFRLTKITDAIGQETILTYGTGTQSLRITKVTDPVGREAKFEYNTSDKLIRITDVQGLTSAFAYTTGGDIVQKLTTGYGTTLFATGGSAGSGFVEVTHPNGERERFEQRNTATAGTATVDPAALGPAGILAFNNYLGGRNTYHWDRKGMAEAAGDYSRARIYHFMHHDLNTRSPVLESIKPPLENRIWFNYQGQNSGGFFSYGMYGGSPSKTAVVLEDGTTQMSTATYNVAGHVTSETDPLGRTLLYAYAPNDTDLTELRRVTGPAGQSVRLAGMEWNQMHLPLSITDAAGQKTVMTYNAAGQPLTVTNPRGEIASFSYTGGYLTAINGPLPGDTDTVSFAYHTFGRVATVTDVDGYVLTYSYDALDRLTGVAYPDGTFTGFGYHLLDFETSRDRRGRVTTYTYDSLRRPLSVTDPLGRKTIYDWCGCSGLGGLIDPMGHRVID